MLQGYSEAELDGAEDSSLSRMLQSSSDEELASSAVDGGPHSPSAPRTMFTQHA